MCKLHVAAVAASFSAQQLEQHDIGACPFAHSGEKAARRDLRIYGYNSSACPDVLQVSCYLCSVLPVTHAVFTPNDAYCLLPLFSSSFLLENKDNGIAAQKACRQMTVVWYSDLHYRHC